MLTPVPIQPNGRLMKHHSIKSICFLIFIHYTLCTTNHCWHLCWHACMLSTQKTMPLLPVNWHHPGPAGAPSIAATTAPLYQEHRLDYHLAVIPVAACMDCTPDHLPCWMAFLGFLVGSVLQVHPLLGLWLVEVLQNWVVAGTKMKEKNPINKYFHKLKS